MAIKPANRYFYDRFFEQKRSKEHIIRNSNAVYNITIICQLCQGGIFKKLKNSVFFAKNRVFLLFFNFFKTSYYNRRIDESDRRQKCTDG